MVTAGLKALIVILFISGLLYSANLAFQGNLETEVVMEDYHFAKGYILGFLK